MFLDKHYSREYGITQERKLNEQTNNTLFRNNPLGIVHFGNPLYFSLWNYMTSTDKDKGGLAVDFIDGYKSFMNYCSKNTDQAFTDGMAAIAISLPAIALGSIVFPVIAGSVGSIAAASASVPLLYLWRSCCWLRCNAWGWGLYST